MHSIAILALALAILLAAPASAQSVGPVKPVRVINFPDPQNVVGTVAVSNLPSVQEVNVTNDATNPVEVVGAVEVTNLSTSSSPSRFQLVGFTSVPYDGDMGGHFGVTLKCQIEFPNSRMCSLEVAATTAIPAGLSGDAWVHSARRVGSQLGPPSAPGGALFDADVRATSSSCRAWRGGGSGQLVGSDGVAASRIGCDEARSIACCASVP